MSDAVRSVLKNWFEHSRIESIQPIASGLSGAAVFRVSIAQGQTWALKRYPLHTSLSRVDQIHRVMVTAKNNGCDVVPELKRCGPKLGGPKRYDPGDAGVPNRYAIDDGQYVWELAQWIDGQPWREPATGTGLLVSDSAAAGDLAANAETERRRHEAMLRGGSAIAVFHRSVRSLGTQLQAPPCVLTRQKRLKELGSQMDAIIASDLMQVEHLHLRFSLQTAIERFRADWNRVTSPLAATLAALSHESVETQIVLGDVHAEHIFFANSCAGDAVESCSVVGIIDFDAVRMDAAATDLARWISSFLGECTDVHTAWHSVLAGYRLESSLDEQQEVIAKSIVQVSAWINLANWATWLLLDHQNFSYDDEQIAQRIDQWIRVIDKLGR
ncbi:phosphotransferase [Novipirellula caenicola]|uniref:Aminoglycoside phosphotransferase domain-containing protein n=1 Tax=Novipirellula caenicola TaxID=1536901 RepID=A0ABP9VKB2_9BACT